MKTLLATLTALLLFFCAEALAKYDLAICAIFQNESLYMKEWLDHHLFLGAEHFYLYNNLSTDDSLEILAPYVEKGLVELYDWPIESDNIVDNCSKVQLPAYNHALKHAKKEAKWLAYIDLDEFIVPMKHNTLPELLRNYEAYGGLAINWQVYGTSNYDTLPEGERLTDCLLYRAAKKHKSNEHVKCIVQPKAVVRMDNPHFALFHKGFYAVDANFNPLPPNCAMQPVKTRIVGINHYWFGTKEWFLTVKRPRREKWGLVIPEEEIEAFIDEHNRFYDPCIRRFKKKQ